MNACGFTHATCVTGPWSRSERLESYVATDGVCANGEAIATKAATTNTTKNDDHDIQNDDRRRAVVGHRRGVAVVVVLCILGYLSA
jgi:hypothetical protein